MYVAKKKKGLNNGTADLRFCFRICKKLVISFSGSNEVCK